MARDETPPSTDDETSRAATIAAVEAEASPALDVDVSRAATIPAVEDEKGKDGASSAAQTEASSTTEDAKGRGAKPPAIARPKRRPAWWIWAGLGIVIVWYWATALWGIAAPFAWGHYGFHAGFHGCCARTLLRHHVLTPAMYSGQAPPPAKTYYLHHPMLVHPYLAVGFALFGQHEWVIRMVPVLFTFAAILALFWVVGRLWNWPAALLAAAVFVLLPQNLIFCQLIDHETPGLLYSMLAAGGLVLWMEQGKRRYAALALASVALAGLTDWPPYPIAFFMALYLGGRAATTLPGRKLGARIVPSGLTGLGVTLLVGLVAYEALKTKLHFGQQVRLPLMAAALAAVTIGLAPTAAVPADKKRPWVALVLWSLIPLATLGFHIWYTKHVGAWHDLTSAFSVRSGGGLSHSFFKHYKTKIVQFMFTKPQYSLGLLWLAILPIRMLFGPLPARTVIPLAFAAAQFLHNMKFPNEINWHNYRAYYYAGFFPMATADLAVLFHGGLAKVPWKKWITRPRRLAPMVPALVVALGALVLLRYQAKAAWAPYHESRVKSGSLIYPYHSHRHEITFCRIAHGFISPRTFVLFHKTIHPRFEDLWYLDRDYGRTYSIPMSAAAARQRARSLFWRPRMPKPPRTNPFVAILYRAAHRPVPRPRYKPSPMPQFHRPVAMLLRLNNARIWKQVGKLAQKYAIRIVHPFAVILYDKKGPDLKVWRLTAVPQKGLARYLRWRNLRLVERPDAGLLALWKQRFAMTEPTNGLHPAAGQATPTMRLKGRTGRLAKPTSRLARSAKEKSRPATHTTTK
ncbi:MAG: glycosyltransferase family 39 protein [Deltaproteobacteria bacterium]|nr:glycosyltransferase family 39 protein [Deltaproteobacteria bacterium]